MIRKKQEISIKTHPTRDRIQMLNRRCLEKDCCNPKNYTICKDCGLVKYSIKHFGIDLLTIEG